MITSTLRLLSHRRDTDILPTRYSHPLDTKKPHQKGGVFIRVPSGKKLLTLTGFETALRLVNDVYAALTAHDTAVAVTLLQRAE